MSLYMVRSNARGALIALPEGPLSNGFSAKSAAEPT
jgi:hypothetical protein